MIRRYAVVLAPLGALVVAGAAPVVDTNALFAALKQAPTQMQAEAIEQKLLAAWHDQATPAVQILMEQAAVLAAHPKPKEGNTEALADADAAIALQPEVADLWRRRAELRFGAGDEDGAIADLAQAVSREPRLIPAWADLSRFSELRKDNKRALEAWQKVLELDPQTDHAAQRLDALQRKANGQPI
jgi:tetratricopeptide (TPR) repeat protein